MEGAGAPCLERQEERSDRGEMVSGKGPSLPRQEETNYPLAAVLAALGDAELHALQEDWNEGLGKQGPLPLYLHLTADGHYTAMMAESVVLDHLVCLTDLFSDAVVEESAL